MVLADFCRLRFPPYLGADMEVDYMCSAAPIIPQQRVEDPTLSEAELPEPPRALRSRLVPFACLPDRRR